MASPITAAGIGSNLDVAGLVQKLMDVERQPVTKLDAKEAAVQVQISAYGTLRGALTSFHTAVKSLTDASRFTATSAKVGDSTIASATAANGATAGSYSLEVTNLAAAQKINSSAFTNVTDVVGSGTLSIQFGTYDSSGNTFTVNSQKTSQLVTIDSNHNTLAGVRDAINAAKIGVSATIVNDGTGNRLVVTSKDTGASSSVRISVADDDGNNTDTSGLSQLAYDPTAAAGSGKNMTQLVAAQDAKFLIDGMQITKSSNLVTDAIQGVTLTLQKPSTVGVPTTITVAQDTSTVTAAVNSFVNAYNDLSKTLKDLGKYDATSKTAGPLQGDVTLRTIANELQQDMGANVAGLNGSYTSLPTVGLIFDRDGKLTLDTKKLTDALSADPASVQKLFTAGGSASDPLVSFISSTASTKPGAYGVNVSQIATAGQAVGSTVAGLTIDGTNDQLSVSVNGFTTSVSLTQGSYANAAALAAELQSKLNGSSALSSNGASVLVSAAGGVLTLSSSLYGSTSSASILGGTGAANLFGTTTETVGLDAAGTIGGTSATGSGQQLTALSGSGAQGLKLSVNGGALGERGQVRFSLGIAAQLDNVLTQLEGTQSSIAARTDSLNRQVKDIDQQRDELNARLDGVEARYKQQFTTLDQLLTQMQQTSSSLSQQLASLPGVSSR